MKKDKLYRSNKKFDNVAKLGNVSNYTIKDIKREILFSLGQIQTLVDEIILFGSRAREDFDAGSDWDFLIVLKKDVSREEKMEIAHRVRRRLAEIYIPCDVIIKSKGEVKKRKNAIGSVIKTALSEGVLL